LNPLGIVAILSLAFIIAYLITPLVIKLAPRVGAVDRPNLRKVHTRTMPRMGGLAIYIAYVTTLLTTQAIDTRLVGLLVGGTLIILLGLVDDIRNLSPRVKLLGQILAALSLVAFGVQVDFITNPISGGIVTRDLSHAPDGFMARGDN
jgi:UDP-GlcNAc:undecaprenyl-phosphate GlcNAc-1-phosphate transferase